LTVESSTETSERHSSAAHTRSLGSRLKDFQWVILEDLFMVLIVLANLSLILFDQTYLWFRPFYYRNFPEILQWYDKPILGIEPHRATESYLSMVRELEYLEKLKDSDRFQKEFAGTVRNLRSLVEKIDTMGDSRFQRLQFEYVSRLERAQGSTRLDPQFVQIGEKILDFASEKNLPYSDLEHEMGRIQRFIHISTEEGWNREREDILARMDAQITQIVETNPFRDSGQTERLERIKSLIKTKYEKVRTRKTDREYQKILTESMQGRNQFPSTTLAFAHFWRNPDTSMQDKLEFFKRELESEFALNYFRNLSKNGKPVNNYLLLDVPFLIFFFLEFCIGWYLAVKRKTYIAWFLYPMYHWYDILGLIPMVEFRFFRLFRVYKIFLILKASRVLPVGEDIISRILRYYSNIIKEEISDMVTIQILSEAQEEIRSGASIQILTNALDSHRTEIKKVVLKKIKETAANDRLGFLLEEITSEIIEKVQNDLKPFGLLPDGFRHRLSKEIAKILHNTVAEAVLSTVDDPAGRNLIESLVDYTIDEFEDTARDSEVNELNTSITVELLENVKKSVARKKWLDSKI